MNKMNVITILFTIIVLVGFMWWGKSIQRPNGVATVETEAKLALSHSESLYDFGTISMKNGNVEHNFKITNMVGKDINLKTVVTSCMCTSAFLEGGEKEKGPFGMSGMGYVPPADEIIKAGESRTIRVVYNPNAHGPAGVGTIDRFITLTDDTGATLQFEIKAVVIP